MIVKVTGNSSDDQLACGYGIVASQMGFQDLYALLHGTSSYQHLGNEDFVSLELLAYNSHRVNHGYSGSSGAGVPSSSAPCTAAPISFAFPRSVRSATSCNFHNKNPPLLLFLLYSSSILPDDGSTAEVGLLLHRADQAIPVCANVFHAVIIQAKQRFRCIDQSQHVTIRRIQNRAVQSIVHSQYQEALID